jgi:hypothetical protein
MGKRLCPDVPDNAVSNVVVYNIHQPLSDTGYTDSYSYFNKFYKYIVKIYFSDKQVDDLTKEYGNDKVSSNSHDCQKQSAYKEKLITLKLSQNAF